MRKNRSQQSDLITEVHNHDLLLDKREIFLYPQGESKDISPFTLVKNLRLLESLSLDPIVIHQYNPGGDIYEGMMAFDAIAQSNCHIITILYGSVMSMGTIITQAADLRIMMPNCTFMVHRTIGVGYESMPVNVASAWCAREKQWEDWMLDLYVKVCTNGRFFKERQSTPQQVKKFIDKQLDKYGDWIISAEEALTYGFIDGIFGSTQYKDIGTILNA